MDRTDPPKWADWFLKWYCHPGLLEELQGDLYELYHYRMDCFGKRYADLRFAWEVLRLVRFPLLKNPSLSARRVLSLASLKVSDQPTWNDILFETRNKDYGAYKIRNAYGGNMLFGFLIVVSIWSLVVFWWWMEFKR